MRNRFVFVAVAGQLLLAGCNARVEKSTPAAPPREVEVLTLAPTEVRDTSEYLGSIISRESVNLSPQVGGYVRRILVKPGQAVKAGDVLVEVDSRQEAAVLESAQAQHNSAKTNFELAQRTLERNESLYKEGLVSAQELERVQAAAKAADASQRAAAAQVSQSRVELGFHAVRAPIPGTAGDVLVRLGDYVTASTKLTSITQGAALEIGITVPAERARDVKLDTPIELLDSSGKVLLTTSVYFVAPQADERTQLVDVRAVFQNSVGIRPNEMLRARIVFGTHQALQVPALAVVRQSGQPFVFALQNAQGGSVVSRRPITLGTLGEKNYVVEKGLNPGDQIAVSSLQALRDGSAVKIKPAPTASQ